MESDFHALSNFEQAGKIWECTGGERFAGKGWRPQRLFMKIMKCAKAIQVLAFGGPEVLQLHDVPIPSVGKGQV